jgi:hypothetical protein
MARLPNPGSDDGTWGNILNDFLVVAHNADGTLQNTGVLASKADDAGVVHLTGNELIAGSKTFNAAPVVPTPTLGSHAANKSYVDSLATGSPTNSHNIAVKTSSYTLTTSDEFILANAASGAITITLPTAASNSCLYTIKKVDSSINIVTLATTSGQTIDGGPSAQLKVQYGSISVISDGSNWLIV